MNTTEGRLRDALSAAGAMVQSSDVPILNLEARRRGAGVRPRRGRRLALRVGVLGAASMAVVAGVSVSGTSDKPRNAAAAEALAPPPGYNVSVFLCSRTSANRLCEGKDVTREQLTQIEQAIRAVPGVRQVRYEPRVEAFRRFKERFSGVPGFQDVRAGDIPDSYRVQADASARPGLLRVMDGRPGVDQVIAE
ncbi:permease-like cell division protein FtsX [Spirillospora sp. NPDC052269]